MAASNPYREALRPVIKSGIMKRRIVDQMDYSTGTAVQDLGRGHYRVEWDEPTPHQDKAKVPVPSKFFAWAET